MFKRSYGGKLKKVLRKRGFRRTVFHKGKLYEYGMYNVLIMKKEVWFSYGDKLLVRKDRKTGDRIDIGYAGNRWRYEKYRELMDIVGIF